MKRYDVEDTEHYIILTKIGTDMERYPAVFRHLQQYQVKLEARYDKGEHWWELRSCDYYAAFDQPKIVFPDIAKNCRFAFDVDRTYLG